MRRRRGASPISPQKPTVSDGSPAPEPEYWFEQEVAEIACLDQPLIPHALDPARPTCTINAGGLALHGKKPAYFAAEGLPRYDQGLQHEREAAGRPVDPTGERPRHWRATVREALAARRAHLASAAADGG
ncbi:hypothetical protein [Methylocystis heyeri]|uniref:Uncharacterized protein n=1 Tax=Methylocystis heyeri TaxID=391905 RepID=A0A6B8KHA3_9HYPH|nr:hypothetical protein [Methylocystis heyeri]QGM46345.1 hypothetical protein H2LOC_011905 [Methylocystis heyeri]